MAKKLEEMDIDERIRIKKKREYKVVKSNELIQKARFDFTVPEQRLIAYICSMIKPKSAEDIYNNSPYQLEYELDIREYCKIIGVDYDSGRNYELIKNQLKALRDKSMWVDFGKTYNIVGWLSSAGVEKEGGKITVEIDKRIAPFLFELQQRFTEYQLYNILEMKGQYSIRFYELFKSHEWECKKNKKSQTTTIEFDLDRLKKLLMVEEVKSYNRFPDFRRFVLESAINEINAESDLMANFTTETQGRKVIKVKFHVRHKTVKELLEQQKRKEKKSVS